MSFVRRILFHAYHLSTGSNYAIRRRLTGGGFLVFGAMLALGAFGADTNFTMAYQAFGFLGALLLVSIAWSLVSRAKFAGERMLPRYGTAGVAMPYNIRIKNLTGRAQRNLVLLESLADPRPSLREYLNTPEPGEHRRNWFDRLGGYYRWRWLLERNLGAVRRDLSVSPLPPRGERVVQHQLVPQRRGVLRLPELLVSWPDPFGLARSVHRVRCPQSVTILPRRYPIGAISLPGKRQYQPRGVSLATSIGHSEEFVALRDYRPGDPLRHVHWRSSAKLNKPVIKEYQDEFFVRHAVVLDTFSDRADEVFEEAVSVAASLACTIPEQESLLDLLFVGSEAYCFTAGRGVSQAEHLLEILASVLTAPAHGFNALRDLVVRHAPLVTGCVCILQAWDSSRQKLVEDLRILNVPVLVLLVVPRAAARQGRLAPPDPGPMKACPENFHVLEVGKIREGLARL